jgi:hypothetical protein
VTEQLEPQGAGRGLQRPVQVHREVVTAAETLHPPDVDDGRGG